MEVSKINVALIGIAERRNKAIADRDKARDLGGSDFIWEVGRIAGLSYALDLLEEAGLPVASAMYLADRHTAD